MVEDSDALGKRAAAVCGVNEGEIAHMVPIQNFEMEFVKDFEGDMLYRWPLPFSQQLLVSLRGGSGSVSIGWQLTALSAPRRFLSSGASRS